MRCSPISVGQRLRCRWNVMLCLPISASQGAWKEYTPAPTSMNKLGRGVEQLRVVRSTHPMLLMKKVYPEDYCVLCIHHESSLSARSCSHCSTDNTVLVYEVEPTSSASAIESSKKL
jgi:hypothetical protein